MTFDERFVLQGQTTPASERSPSRGGTELSPEEAMMHTSAHHVKDRQELVREREERFQARRSQVRTRATLHRLAEKN